MLVPVKPLSSFIKKIKANHAYLKVAGSSDLLAYPGLKANSDR